MNIETLVRPEILSLQPYSCAKKEFNRAGDFALLNANENAFNEPLNRYPDPSQFNLKEEIINVWQQKYPKINAYQIFLGNGSDEAIDLVFRIFCIPEQDNVISIEPSYGMYKVCANINGVKYNKVDLNKDFTLNADRVLAAVNKKTKVIFLCSPNNPSGNLLNRTEVLKIIEGFSGIVVIDEAYIDFSSEKSWLEELDNYSNIIVLQTFSKAWGLAAMRCGMAFANKEIISFFNKVKYPYNLNQLTQNALYKFLRRNGAKKKDKWVEIITKQRKFLEKELGNISVVEKIYSSDANFLLVQFSGAENVYSYLEKNNIIVRNRCHEVENSLRITIGTQKENKALIQVLKNFTNQNK